MTLSPLLQALSVKQSLYVELTRFVYKLTGITFSKCIDIIDMVG